MSSWKLEPLTCGLEVSGHHIQLYIFSLKPCPLCLCTQLFKYSFGFTKCRRQGNLCLESMFCDHMALASLPVCLCAYWWPLMWNSPCPVPILFSSLEEYCLVGKGCSVEPEAPCSVGSSPPDVNDLLKFIRPLHEGTLVFVASYDDPATK